MPDLTPFIAAAKAHQWVLLAALIVYLLVGLTKQGWFSTWLAARLSPRLLPWYALLISVASLGSSEIISGKAWQSVLTDCFMAAFAAVAAHQFGIESILGGREVIPQTAKMKLLTGGK